jgi:hypothetical protein
VVAPHDPVGEREESMRVQLAGHSSAVTQTEAEAGLAAAQADLAGGKGSGYGVGFGFVKSFGSPNALDGIRVEFALTDGQRVANVHAIVSGSHLASLRQDRDAVPDQELLVWMYQRLYQISGAIARDHDRYRVLLENHPLALG